VKVLQFDFEPLSAVLVDSVSLPLPPSSRPNSSSHSRPAARWAVIPVWLLWLAATRSVQAMNTMIVLQVN